MIASVGKFNKLVAFERERGKPDGNTLGQIVFAWSQKRHWKTAISIHVDELCALLLDPSQFPSIELIAAGVSGFGHMEMAGVCGYQNNPN